MLTQNEIEKFFNNIDPMTIIPDRYMGTYSGGRFLAFFLDYWDIPDGVCSGDFECRAFWETYEGRVGRGNTPDEAAKDLAEQLKEDGVSYFFR